MDRAELSGKSLSRVQLQSCNGESLIDEISDAHSNIYIL